MLIVIMLISIALIVLDDVFDLDGCGLAVGGCIAIVTMIAAIVITAALINLRSIEDKIAMHEEENRIIEVQIAEAINSYQEHEKDVFAAVAPESAITLVSLYPEIKSDQLVAAQIDIYVENTNTIRELKEELLNARAYRWWLFFGS